MLFRKLLSNTATKLDTWMSNIPSVNCSEEELAEFKRKLMDAECLSQLVGIVFSDELAATVAAWEYGQSVISEIAALSTLGPLSEFPSDINSNVYARICQYGMEKLPLLTTLLARLSIRSSKAVLPGDVITVANALSNLCYLVNRRTNGVMRTRSFLLQCSGTSDEGLGLLHKSGLATTARHLNQFRDKFAEAGPLLLQKLAQKLPTQVLLDNLNFRTSAGAPQENLMLKCSIVETVDTRGLSTASMEKADVLDGFNVEKVLLHSPGHVEERQHLERLIARGYGLSLAGARPRAEKLGKLLKLAPKKIACHLVNIDKVYPATETSHSDMVRMAYQVQDEYLKLVANYMNGSANFMADLMLLENSDVEVAVREAAEQRVKAAAADYGEWISYGDQLTWQIFQDIRVIVAQEITAYERLEFLGKFRLGGLHSLMKKDCLDYSATMKKLSNFHDPCYMSLLVSRFST